MTEMTFAIYGGYGKSVRVSKKLTNSPNEIISKKNYDNIDFNFVSEPRVLSSFFLGKLQNFDKT